MAPAAIGGAARGAPGRGGAAMAKRRSRAIVLSHRAGANSCTLYKASATPIAAKSNPSSVASSLSRASTKLGTARLSASHGANGLPDAGTGARYGSEWPILTLLVLRYGLYTVIDHTGHPPNGLLPPATRPTYGERTGTRHLFPQERRAPWERPPTVAGWCVGAGSHRGRDRGLAGSVVSAGGPRECDDQWPVDVQYKPASL